VEETRRVVLDLSYRQSEELEESTKDFRHSVSVKPLPHTTVTCASCGRSFRKEGGMDGKNRSEVVIISPKKGQRQDL